MRKVGMANLYKAQGFQQQQNYGQSLRYGELAATKLKQIKDRRLETVEVIDLALIFKFNALQRLGRNKEAMECIKECYTLWAMNHLRNPGSMKAALSLIQSCLHNEEFEDAERYARHAYFMIAEMTDNFIPVEQRPRFLADGSFWLARAILGLAEAGGIPPAEKQKAGEEAIAFARKALEIHNQLDGSESVTVATDMSTVAQLLDYFNDVDDDEFSHLHQQAIAINRRVEGSLSFNVAAGERNFGIACEKRAERAEAANDLDRCMANYELALTHSREAARILGANNRMDMAGTALRFITIIEENIRRVGIARAAAAAAAAVTRR